MTSALPLAIDRVSVTFGGVLALDGVSLDVEGGSVHGIVGPNGSGKTTLLNAISGFVPAAGAITLAGQSLQGKSPHARASLGLARTFQSPRVPGDLTVWQLLRVGEHLRKRQGWWKVAAAPWRAEREDKESRHAAEELLRTLDLPPDLLDVRMSDLPGGTLKLIDLARALMQRPSVLLLDEPTSGMAEDEVRTLEMFLARLRDQAITVVMVEHNIPFVTSGCDIVTVLALGRKLSEAHPESVFAEPEVIEAYLGDAPVAS